MSLFKNVLVLYICVALGLSAMGFQAPITEFANGTLDFKGLVEVMIGSFGFGEEGNINVSNIATTLGLLVAATLVGGGFTLPVIMAVFVAIFLLPLFSFTHAFASLGEASVYYNVFYIVQILLQFLFTIGLVDWIRGEYS